MTRTKGGGGQRVKSPARQQDASSLPDAIARLVEDTLVEPLSERVDALEDALTAISRGTPHTATVSLMPNGRGAGVIDFQPVQGFQESAVGQPVIITQGPGPEDEFGIVLFTARVIDKSTMRLSWYAPHGAPQTLDIVYLIG